MADVLEKKTETSNLLYQVVLELPDINRSILAFLILHLKKYIAIVTNIYCKIIIRLLFFLYSVADSPKCCMDYNSLAIVFGPTIVGLSSTCLDDLHIKSEVIFNVRKVILKIFTFKVFIKIKTRLNYKTV